MLITTFHHHQNGNSIHGFQRTTVGIAEIHCVRLVRQTAFGRDVATQVATKVIMAVGQNVATKKITAMGHDGATKVEPAIRRFGGANRGAHRGLGRASTTPSREEVTSHMDPTIAHDMRGIAKGRVHAPATK